MYMYMYMYVYISTMQGRSKHFYSGPARAWHGEATPFMTSYCACARMETLRHGSGVRTSSQFELALGAMI